MCLRHALATPPACHHIAATCYCAVLDCRFVTCCGHKNGPGATGLVSVVLKHALHPCRHATYALPSRNLSLALYHLVEFNVCCVIVASWFYMSHHQQACISQFTHGHSVSGTARNGLWLDSTLLLSFQHRMLALRFSTVLHR